MIPRLWVGLKVKMARTIVCELCGYTFICQTEETECWCNQITLTPEATDELRKTAKDCVCQDCLTEFATRSP